ncbi:uncharacterized protein LOC144130470 [Amblyomma americanum]
MCSAALLIGGSLIAGGIFVVLRQGEATQTEPDVTESYQALIHVEPEAQSVTLNDARAAETQLSQTPFVCTVGLSLDVFKHASLLREDGLCEYLIFHSTFLVDSEGRADLWDGRNRTRAFHTFLAFAKVSSKTAYGVAIAHRKSGEALRQLGTAVGIGEFVTYWANGVRHHAVLDVHERYVKSPRDLRLTFALLKAFKLLQQAQQENATSNAAVIFFGCTSVLPKKSLLHDVLRKELRLLPVDVMILTTHVMVSEDSERLVVPPTALRASEGGYPPSLLDVAQHAAEAEYMNQPTAIAFTLTASVLAYEVPERTRVGAACERGPIQATMKEVCGKSNYPVYVKYGNNTIIGRSYSPTTGRLYLFDTKETFHFKMCTVREEIPDFVHGWVIFNVDMADYDGSCNGASRTLERVRAIRETFDEYRKLDVGQPPDEAC